MSRLYFGTPEAATGRLKGGKTPFKVAS
jgi:hypothetical protein